MTVPDAPRLRALEAENARVKRLLAEAIPDNAALKDLATRNRGLPTPTEEPYGM